MITPHRLEWDLDVFSPRLARSAPRETTDMAQWLLAVPEEMGPRAHVAAKGLPVSNTASSGDVSEKDGSATLRNHLPSPGYLSSPN